MSEINPGEPLPRHGVASSRQLEDVMRKATPRTVTRPAALDEHDMVGLWSTALWVLAAAVLLATFGIH